MKKSSEQNNDDNMIGMEEILTLIDERYGYGQDALSKKLLSNIAPDNSGKHLVDRRKMLRWFDNYAGEANYLSVINSNNKGTKAAKYAREDIEKVINSPQISERIKKSLSKKTKDTPFGLIPICILHQYIEEETRDTEAGTQEADLYFLELTGYTEHQITLFSVPDDILSEAKYDVISEIQETESKLAELKTKYADICYELKSRGFSD